MLSLICLYAVSMLFYNAVSIVSLRCLYLFVSCPYYVRIPFQFCFYYYYDDSMMSLFCLYAVSILFYYVSNVFMLFLICLMVSLCCLHDVSTPHLCCCLFRVSLVAIMFLCCAYVVSIMFLLCFYSVLLLLYECCFYSVFMMSLSCLYAVFILFVSCLYYVRIRSNSVSIIIMMILWCPFSVSMPFLLCFIVFPRCLHVISYMFKSVVMLYLFCLDYAFILFFIYSVPIWSLLCFYVVSRLSLVCLYYVSILYYYYVSTMFD